ncbi:ABC transporter ATP-binding protein [Martelella radicis]|uniref:ABC-type lipoprotein export system ATPase subunit n=1 Tax=Martelella radicis TaxID=1397476 RepID=A0A7W6KFH1_9HYPH|nr:ABC transporter ATP-binding protein [Martelella radicis]MBB4120288.1 ABC-type lipoprotein export system ATPase subunit [Martelella radicis]
MSEMLLDVRGVGKSVTSSSQTIEILKAVDLALRPGERLCIIGASGSGKSSLLEILGTLSIPDKGRVLISGRDVIAIGDAEKTRLRRQSIGFVFQGFNLIDHVSAADNVALPLRYQGIGRKAALRRALAELDRVGLSARAGLRCSRLSGGEKQRVALARALVTRPRLILSDEPTGNLDEETGRHILRLLMDSVSEDCGLVMVTHNLEYARRFDRVVKLSGGCCHDVSP